MHRVFVVDDHDIVREGLACIIERVPGFELAGEAHDGWDLVDKLTGASTDLVLLDFNMPGPDIIELIGNIKQQAPDVAILVLSMVDEISIVVSALKAGAKGYLTKNNDPATIIQAMLRCVSGDGYIQPDLAARLINAENQLTKIPLHEQLSEREKQIFMFLANGVSINEISQKLNRSPKTISTHKFRIMQKIALQTNTDLVRYAIKHKLIEV